MSRLRFVTVFVLVLAVSATARAELRNWLVDGEPFRGEYEGIQDGNVVLRNGGQQRRIHFYALSEADQQYLRKQLEAAGKGDLIPKVGPLRTWTDSEGNTFNGRLIAADDRAAYVLVGSTQYRLPLDELPPADFEHVETTLGQWGITLKPITSARPPAESDNDERPEKSGRTEPPPVLVHINPMEPRGSDSPGAMPLSPGDRPAYVPPSNTAAALALNTLNPLPGAMADTPTDSGGASPAFAAVLAVVVAGSGLALRHMAQRAE